MTAFRSSKWLGHLAMMVFALLIAGSFSLGARAAPYIESGALNAVRFALATLVMGSVVLMSSHGDVRRHLIRPTGLWRFGVLGALMGAYFVTMFMALKVTSPVSTGAVFTLMPLMTAGFAYIFVRQVAGPALIASLLIAGAGALWIIFRGDVNALLSFDIGRGEVIYFFGCAAHAAYAPLVKRFNRGEPVRVFTFWTLAGAWACISLYAAPEILTTDWLALPAIVWTTVAYLAVFTTAGTFFLLQFAAMRIPASKAIAYGYLTPVNIIVLEGLAGAGWASPQILVGALVTVVGLVILVFAPER